MINFTLYKRGMRENRTMLLVFASVLALYFIIIMPMFDPELGSMLDEFSKAMPEMMALFGMNPSASTMLGFLSAYLYGFLMPVFPMVFTILCANRLIARLADRGSLAYLLAAPVRRKTIAFTQMKVLASCILALTAFSTAVGVVTAELSFPGLLDIPGFLLLNTGTLCLQLFIGGICFLCSCAFNDAKYSLSFGAGIPSISYLIQMLANTGLDKAKYLSFFSLFNPDAIISGENAAMLGPLALFSGAVVLYAAAIIVFVKKDLHT